MRGDLTNKQLAFCHEYMKDRNATKAAERAGYSAATAESQGCRLLKHSLVAPKIASMSSRIEKKSELSAAKVMDALSNLVDFDPAQLYGEDGKLLPINKMPLEARKVIAGIDGDKLRFTSRLGAIELAAKVLQLVKQEQVQQQAVQIIIAAPAAPLVERVENSKLLPEWE